MNRSKFNIKLAIFYWITSYISAVLIYYLLFNIFHHVFGELYRMFLYHEAHPLEYIAIPCFFYGIIAPFFATKFLIERTLKKIGYTFLIIFLTVFVSCPIGGMLWNYHDMQAGYFPPDWISKMISNGLIMGFECGWLIILLSVPYNIIGCIICYFLTASGAKIFYR